MISAEQMDHLQWFDIGECPGWSGGSIVCHKCGKDDLVLLCYVSDVFTIVDACNDHWKEAHATD